MSVTAANQTTLLDIAKANGSDAMVGLIDETIHATPEVELVPARTIKGINYKTWIRTALPTVPFRQGNTGASTGKSVYENRTVDTFIMNPRIQVDKAIADAYEDGAPAYIATEADAIMKGAMLTLGQQFYYGVSNDANGHPGLQAMYDATNLTVDAGGTTANTGTSVYAVKFGAQYCQWVWGLNGQLALSDVMLQPINDANGNPYTGYVQEINARPGLQLGSLLGVGCIKNITADVGHTLTDALLAQILSQFRVGIRPDAIFMTRRARAQLQKSRSVTLFGNSNSKVSGKEAIIAPTPTEYDGVPIYPTEALSDTEALR